MRTLAIALLTCSLALAADNPFVGTWTMNKSKSKLVPNAQPFESLTVQYVQDGASLKATITANGTSGRTEVFDGKEHQVTPNRTGTIGRMGATHYMSTVNGNTIKTLFKKDGKTVGTRTVTASPDGKMLTGVTEGTFSNGQKFQGTVIFEKQ